MLLPILFKFPPGPGSWFSFLHVCKESDCMCVKKAMGRSLWAVFTTPCVITSAESVQSYHLSYGLFEQLPRGLMVLGVCSFRAAVEQREVLLQDGCVITCGTHTSSQVIPVWLKSTWVAEAERDCCCLLPQGKCTQTWHVSTRN